MYYEDPNLKKDSGEGAPESASHSGGARYNPTGNEDEPSFTGRAYNGSPDATYSAAPRGDQSNPYSGGQPGGAQGNPGYNPYYQPQYNAQYSNPTPPHQNPPKKKKKSGGRVAALILSCAIIGGAAGFGGAYAALKLTGNNVSINRDTATVYASDRTPTITNTELVEAGEAMTTSQIYQNFNDSVVCITVQTNNGTGAGTGFFISDDGYIMTCYHVVDGQTAMSVTLNDGSSSYEATYVGGDEEQDVAIIKITPKDSETFHAVTLGNSDTLQVGSTVTAIGNALGELANTTTGGMVSALNRAITMSDGTVMNLLQTDCTINSGNSGGPLFNEYGEVVGIVNAKYSSSIYDSSATIEGIGFAIPINSALDIMSDLMQYGYITGKPYLGITVSTITSIQAQMYPGRYVVGALVNSVSSGSCAETAGLQAGDIITQVDGEEITTSAELIDAKKNHKAGEQMTMLVYRNGEYYTITVTLDEEQPDTSATQNDNSSGQGGQNDQSGQGSQGGQGGQGSQGGSYNPFGGWGFGNGW